MGLGRKRGEAHVVQRDDNGAANEAQTVPRKRVQLATGAQASRWTFVWYASRAAIPRVSGRHTLSNQSIDGATGAMARLSC